MRLIPETRILKQDHQAVSDIIVGTPFPDLPKLIGIINKTAVKTPLKKVLIHFFNPSYAHHFNIVFWLAALFFC
jgi:hypothetical protein